MNTEELTQTAIAAQTYNNSEAFDVKQFRFKNYDGIDKSRLFTLRNTGLISEIEDPWNTTTWEWTESGSVAVSMVESTIIDEATEDQLKAIERQGNKLLRLPRDDTFLANEYGLLGEQIKTLSSTNLIEQTDEAGQLAVWSLTNFALRLLTSLEAAERRNNSN